jgi:hypothetical protein
MPMLVMRVVAIRAGLLVPLATRLRPTAATIA